MNETITVGEAIARTLEQYQLGAIYGIISIHNLPIADAIGQRDRIRFIPTRGEAGAVTMADAYSRFTGLGVALTSTGVGAGNAVGAMIEALNANSPLLHITGQVEKAYLDQDTGFIHETRDQLGFLRASSKHVYRIYHAEQAVAILHKAIQQAQTVPCGPVSIEIPIDIQSSKIAITSLIPAFSPVKATISTYRQQVEYLYALLAESKRPLLWVGHGAINALDAIKTLADAGIAVISSTHGRGILADSHPRSLRAFHNSPAIEQLMQRCDLTIVAGSRLRSNETKTWSLPLPNPLIQIDIDPAAANRNYIADHFICGDCQDVLTDLAQYCLETPWKNDFWNKEIQQAVSKAEQQLREQSGPYAQLNDAIEKALPANSILVRDITVSGSVWGSRLLKVERPLRNIHSLAGAIGLGLSMAIGSAIANPKSKILALVGDGGLMLGVGELATLAQESLNITVLVMNDQGYGVMRGIQNKYFQGRQYYNELLTPSFCKLAQAMGIKNFYISQVSEFYSVMAEAVDCQGPTLVEIDMSAIGSINFAGPPQKTLY